MRFSSPHHNVAQQVRPVTTPSASELLRNYDVLRCHPTLVAHSSYTYNVPQRWPYRELTPIGVMPDVFGVSMQEAGIEESIMRGVEP